MEADDPLVAFARINAIDQYAVINAANKTGNGSAPTPSGVQASTTTYLTVTAGLNTFTLDYKGSTSGTQTFANRSITVIPLN